ncbi:MAG: glycosyltransferase [Candidatus Shapirobacteria bacterium]
MNTKILLLVARDGYSFINQAKALSKGLGKLRVQNKVIRVTKKYPKKEILEYRPSIVVGVGSWRSYPELVRRPQQLGFRVLPWLVSDNRVDDFVGELNNLDFFLTTSNHCRNVFMKFGVKREKINVLYETVDTDFWKEISSDDLDNFLNFISIREEGVEIPPNYDLTKIKQQKIPVLFTTGGDATNKGAQEILKALSLLDQKIPWIYIIKTWPSPGSFQRSIEELQIVIKRGMWEKVRYFSGEFSKEFIRSLMNVCDIYVACSRSEGFGLPLVEAQLCGKPVVTMKGTSTSEVVEDGVGGLFCQSVMTKGGPRANVEDLSKVLKRILTNKELIKALGSKARPWAMNKFAPEKIASELLIYIK